MAHHPYSLPPLRMAAGTSIVMALAAAAVLWTAPQAHGSDAALVTGPAAARLGEPNLRLVTGIIRSLRMRDWDIAVCDDDGVPKGWHSLSGGLHLRLTENGRSADVWALPNDWVAVRTRTSSDPEDPPARIITVAGVLWATMSSNVCGRFFERFADPVPTYDPATHGGHGNRPTPKQWTPEQVTRLTALAAEALNRFCVLPPERAAGIRSLASLGVPAHALYRELSQDHDLLVRDAAIAAQALVADDATIRFLGGLLTREDADPDHRQTVLLAAQTLREIAVPTAIPDLLTALDHLDDAETVGVVVATLALLRCQAASPRILDLMRRESDRSRRVAYAKALSTLRAREAIPLIKELIPSTDITGQDIFNVPRNASLVSPRLSYLKLTAPWGATVGHVRFLLLPFIPVVPLGKDCLVTLLIESCGEAIDSVTYLDGVLTVDGIEHQHSSGSYTGNFTVSPGNVGEHQLDLSAFISAPGTHRVGYRCDGLIANDIDIEVAAAK